MCTGVLECINKTQNLIITGRFCNVSTTGAAWWKGKECRQRQAISHHSKIKPAAAAREWPFFCGKKKRKKQNKGDAFLSLAAAKLIQKVVRNEPS